MPRNNPRLTYSPWLKPGDSGINKDCTYRYGLMSSTPMDNALSISMNYFIILYFPRLDPMPKGRGLRRNPRVKLTTSLSNTLVAKLNLISKITGHHKSDLLDEGVWHLIQKYKHCVISSEKEGVSIFMAKTIAFCSNKGGVGKRKSFSISVDQTKTFEDIGAMASSPISTTPGNMSPERITELQALMNKPVANKERDSVENDMTDKIVPAHHEELISRDKLHAAPDEWNFFGQPKPDQYALIFQTMISSLLAFCS